MLEDLILNDNNSIDNFHISLSIKESNDSNNKLTTLNKILKYLDSKDDNKQMQSKTNIQLVVQGAHGSTAQLIELGPPKINCWDQWALRLGPTCLGLHELVCSLHQLPSLCISRV